MKNRIDFVRTSKITLIVSALLIVASILSVILKGGFKLGIDFAGGTAFNMYFPKKMNMDAEKIKDIIKKINASGEVTTSRTIGEGGKRSFYITLREHNVKVNGKDVKISDMFLHEMYKKYDNISADLTFNDKEQSIVLHVKNNAINIDKLVKILALTAQEKKNLEDQMKESNEKGKNKQVEELKLPEIAGVIKDSVQNFTSKFFSGKVYKLENKKGFKIQIKLPKNFDKQNAYKRFRSFLFERLLKLNELKIKIEGRQFIGPKIGAYFIRVSIEVIILVSIIILIYVAIRFQFKFGLASVVALLHDTIIMIGFVSLFEIEMDITIIAAILTILGYSINDTIVVFDRIRENTEKISTNKDEYIMIVNRSIWESLSRTLITSFTTFIVVFVLLMWGGDALFNFYLLLLVGIFFGTYSSIFVASPTLVIWDRFIEAREKKKKKKRKKVNA